MREREDRSQWLLRLALIVLDAHDKAIRSPNLAAHPKPRAYVRLVPPWTPLGNDSLGVGGNNVPAVGISVGWRPERIIWLVTNEDSSVPGAADPSAGVFTNRCNILPLKEVFDTILGVVLADASRIECHTVFLCHLSVTVRGLDEL